MTGAGTRGGSEGRHTLQDRSPTKDPPLLSVIIPTHKRPGPLARLLEALSQQSFSARDFEVIVVMDGPSPGTEALLKNSSFPFQLRSFAQPERGAPAARNLGVREARGDLLVFLDDDIIPSRNFLALHHQAHGQEDRVVIGGLKPAADSPSPFVAEVADWTQAHFDRCSAPGHELSHLDLADGNFSARKQDILRAGGWDESFVGFGGDDDREVGLRLKGLGLSIQFEPRALGRHFYSKTWKRMLQDRREAGRAHRYYLGKHPDRIREFSFTPWAAGGCWRRAVLRSVGLAPEFIFALFSWVVKHCGESFDPRYGRALFRFLAKGSALAFYLRGFWDDRPTARDVYRQLGTKVPVLCYHRVAPERMPGSNLTVTVGEFERQMTYLSRRKYQTISLNDFHNWQSSLSPLPAKPVILTFDDGYAGFLDHVAPILAKHGFSATIFLLAGRIGREVRWEGHRPLGIMSREEAAELARRGFDIQGHGVEHHDWTSIEPDAVREELTGSARIIEEITGRPVRFFAYPLGHSTAGVRELARSLGYCAGCTVRPGRNTFFQDSLLLKRDLVLPGKGFWQMIRALHR
jgi:peptidoglycan/xylan/chitin deacetylase (PgdA/CDA1 family)/glycosyltransferase involved in cell wall biosynthesis